MEGYRVNVIQLLDDFVIPDQFDPDIVSAVKPLQDRFPAGRDGDRSTVLPNLNRLAFFYLKERIAWAGQSQCRTNPFSIPYPYMNTRGYPASHWVLGAIQRLKISSRSRLGDPITGEIQKKQYFQFTSPRIGNVLPELYQLSSRTIYSPSSR